MYYISENKQDLEDYNTIVTQGQNYKGTTTRWSKIKKHYNQDLYAIMVNENYPSNLPIIHNLDSWFNTDEI